MDKDKAMLSGISQSAPNKIAVSISLALPIALAFLIELNTVAPAAAKKQDQSSVIVQARAAARHLNATTARQLEHIAQGLISQRRMTEAKEISEIVCNSKFASAESYSILANSYLNGLGDDSNNQSARTNIDKALKLDPKSVAAYSVMAVLANEEGRFADAIKAADKALACPHPSIEAYQSKAAGLSNLGRNSEALVVIEKAQALDIPPKNPGILWFKGNILESLKRFKEAGDCYEKSLKMYDTDWVYFRVVHCLEMQNRFPEAITYTDKIISRNSKDGEAYRTRALLKVKSKDLVGAIKDYDTCLALEPTAKTFHDRAQLHLKLGHKDLYQKDQAAALKIESRPF